MCWKYWLENYCPKDWTLDMVCFYIFIECGVERDDVITFYNYNLN